MTHYITEIDGHACTPVEGAYYCDGHHITAQGPDDARSACESLYGYSPEIVRPWTSDDDAEHSE